MHSAIKRVVRNLGQAVGAGTGRDGGAGAAARLADRAQRVAQVGSGLHVQCDAVGACAGDLRHVALRALDHQMRIDDRPGRVDPVGDGGKNDRSKADRGDEVTIHYVDVDHAGSGGEHLLDLSAEAGAIGRQDGWSDKAIDREIRGPQTRLLSGVTLLDVAAELSRVEHFRSGVVQPEALSELVEPRGWLRAAS